MRTKRTIKKCIAMITVLTLCLITALPVFAMEQVDTEQQGIVPESETPSTRADDGWSGGGFFNASGYHTGAKYFKGGTIYVGLNSTNQTSTGNYYVWLKNYNTGATTSKISVPKNGLCTVNFTNMPSGTYQLYMSKSESSSYQAYTIPAYGTIN